MRNASYGPFDEATIDRAARAMFADWVENDPGYTGTGDWDKLGDEIRSGWRTSAVKVLRATFGEGGSDHA